MTKQGFATAKRRYHSVFWPMMGIYVAAVMGGSTVLNVYDEPPVALAVGIALACAIPMMFVLLAVLRYFSETDEYTRLRQLIAFARGAALTVSAVFVVGFLQLFDIIGGVTVFWFGPLFFLSWGLFYCFGDRFGKNV